MSRALSVDAGYDRWKRNDTEKRSREPSGTFPRIQRMMDSDQRTETEKEKGNGGEREGREGASVDDARKTAEKRARDRRACAAKFAPNRQKFCASVLKLFCAYCAAQAQL